MLGLAVGYWVARPFIRQAAQARRDMAAVQRAAASRARKMRVTPQDRAYMAAHVPASARTSSRKTEA